MTPTQLKAVNTTAAVVFSMTGLACFALAGYLALTPAPPRAAQYLQRTPDVANCLQVLHSLGMTAQKESANRIKAHVEQSVVDQNPKEYLELASVGIATCKLPLRSFCMGIGCKASDKLPLSSDSTGLTFLLDTADPYGGPEN